MSEVTEASVIPHGTIATESREVALGVERETVHRDPAGDPDPDGGDLAVRAAFVGGHPDPERPSTWVVASPELGAHRHQGALEPADMSDDVVGRWQAHDRVADQLARGRAR